MSERADGDSGGCVDAAVTLSVGSLAVMFGLNGFARGFSSLVMTLSVSIVAAVLLLCGWWLAVTVSSSSSESRPRSSYAQ